LCFVRENHRVDITEGTSAQFLTYIFNFGPYGQLRHGNPWLRAVREKNNYELLATFGGDFFMFSRAMKKLYSVHAKK
jgi:hypothetical protein